MMAFASRPGLAGILSFGFGLLFRLGHFNGVSAFYTSKMIRQSIAKGDNVSSKHKLFGISEWRSKFSGSSSGDSSRTINSYDGNSSSSVPASSLPLLLLPFEPSQILLPGESTTLEFRHGKYLDMIDESLTCFESVVGMSVLDEDGLLPYVVVCEVLEEELELNMGYRGFSSMSVGLTAVGRARRVVGDEKPKNSGSGGISESIFHGRTALNDIHLGQIVEWPDDALDDERQRAASEYLETIERILVSSQNLGESNELDDRIQRQQVLFRKAYTTALQHLSGTTSPDTSVQQQKLDHLVASSWAVLAVAEGDLRSSSIITQALATKDTVERLRLGLAMMLERKIPDEDSVGGTDVSSDDVAGDAQANSFQ